MAKVYLFADETGNLDYSSSPDPRGGGASIYFGFGTAAFSDTQYANAVAEAHELRASLASSGLANGFHACADSNKTRSKVFEMIRGQQPRFDTTFLYKANAYPDVREKGGLYLYKLAWHLHVKQVALQVSDPGDELVIVAAEFGTARMRQTVDEAVNEVCSQIDRDITTCIWRAPTSWGLQAADYGLWATQRIVEGKRCTWFDPCIAPTLKSTFKPWGEPEV